MRLALPYPPSVNHYWRHWRGRTLISRAGREYRAAVCQLLARPAGQGGEPPRNGRVALCMDAFPPDRRRRDLDNIQKPVLDALEHARTYEDDSQIDFLLTRRSDLDRPHGHIAVHIDPLPLFVCPACGRALPHGDGTV